MKQIIQQLLSCLILSVVFCTTAWADTGLSFLEKNGESNYYKYVGDETTMVENATFYIEMSGTTPYFRAYTTDSNNPLWLQWGTGAKSFSAKLTAEDVTKLRDNNYEITIVVSAGECTKASFSTGTGGTGGTVIPPSAGTLEEKIAAKAQLTNVPTIYLTIPDVTNIDADLKKDRGTNTAEYHRATIQVVDNSDPSSPQHLESFTDELDIKVRGNSTADVAKRPYRFKFIKDETGTHKHDLLGKGYAKRNWALLANYYDGSMIRNALNYHIGQLVGMEFCPGYKFVDLVINGDYRGTYQVTDHVEVGSHRIDVDEATGWYIESNGQPQMAEEPKTTGGSMTMSIKNPEPVSGSAEETKLKSDVQNWYNTWEQKCRAITADYATSRTEWRSCTDIESLVAFYVGTNFTANYDGFMTVKMFRDVTGTDTKLHFGPLWDMDLAYGHFTGSEPGKRVENIPNGNFRWYIQQFWEDPLFIKKVHEKWHALTDNELINTLNEHIDDIAYSLRETQALNYQRWPVLMQGMAGSYESYDASVTFLKEFIAEHIPLVEQQIDNQYAKLKEQIDNLTEEDENPGTGGGETNKEPAFEEEVDSGIAFGNWDYKQIPSSLFNSKATSATIKVIGAVYACISKSNNESGALYKSSYTDANKSGITYVLEGENLELAKKGSIYIGCNNDAGIKLTVTNHGVDDGNDDNPSDEDPFNEHGARKQLTANIPTIYIDTNAAVGDSWGGATLDIYDSSDILNSTTWKSKSVYVQYQGSGAGGKDSYRLKFDKKTQMMDSGSFKQWVLLANDDDPTMLNNALAKVIGDAVGMPYTPGCQFVDLYVNNTYMGTYQLTDRVKAELYRSLVADGDNTYDWHVRFNDEGEINEDKKSGLLDTDYIAGTETMPNIVIKNPDPDDYHTANDEAGLATLKSTMSEYFTTVFATDESGNYTNIADMVNTDQLVAWYIAQEILGVYKGFSSIEAYRSVTSATDQKLHFGPLWDSEKGFGNTGEVTAPDNTTDLNNDATHNGLMISWSAYPMMKNLFTNLWTQPWFKTAVKTKWEEISSTLPDALSQTITTLSGTIAESQALNAQKWSNSLGNYSSYEDALAATNAYITARFDYLDKKFAVLAEGACEHTYNSQAYANNGDGTHSPKCDKCDFVNTEEKTIHIYTAKNNHPYCDICKASESASIEGTVADNTKVYRIHEAVKTTDIKYVTAESNFAPSGNKIYICNEEITGEANNLTNVVWPRSADTDYNGNEIILSDGDYTYDEKANMHVKTASYTRSMSSTWGTLCLPFKVKSCDDYTLYEISKARLNDDETGTLVFEEIQEASGLQPVVFRKKTSAGSVTFHGVTQTKEGPDNGLVTVKKSKKLGNTDALISTGVEGSGTWALYGNVKKSNNTAEISPDHRNVYYIASNKFWQATDNVTVATFRSVFVFTPTSGNEAAAKSFSLAISDDATAINDNVISKNLAIFTGNGEVILESNYDARVSIYNVNGASVANTDLENGMSKHIALPKGIYIVNGTKVVVK